MTFTILWFNFLRSIICHSTSMNHSRSTWTHRRWHLLNNSECFTSTLSVISPACEITLPKNAGAWMQSEQNVELCQLSIDVKSHHHAQFAHTSRLFIKQTFKACSSSFSFFVAAHLWSVCKVAGWTHFQMQCNNWVSLERITQRVMNSLVSGSVQTKGVHWVQKGDERM